MAQAFDLQSFMNAWNSQQTERILGFYADDAELYVPPDTEPYRGKDAIRRNISEVVQGIGDVNGDIVSVVQDSRKVAALVIVTGKHTGDLVVSEDQVIPATGRDLRFQMSVFIELDDDGKIRRETDIADNLSILQQVGALEPEQVGRTSGRAR